MRAAVTAAEEGNSQALAHAAQRWSPHSRSVRHLLQPVVESLWPLLVRHAATVVIDDAIDQVILGDDVDPDQFQQLMDQLLCRRLEAVDGHQPQRRIHIGYDPTTSRLCMRDNGYPINQPYKVHWIEQQARDCEWSAQVHQDAGQNVITFSPHSGRLEEAQLSE